MDFSFYKTPYFYNIIYTFLSFIIIYFITRFLRRLVNIHIQDLKRRHRIRKAIFYCFSVIFILILFGIWTTALPSYTTLVGFIGAGLALALHEAVLCIAGWILINVKKTYEVGERIEANNIKGDVIDIGVFHTVLIEVGNWVDADQSTGRIVSIPNSYVFRQPIFNYTKEFEYIWNEIPILVTFESNWRKGKDIILATAQENADETRQAMNKLIEKMSDRYMVHYSKLTPVVYTRIMDCGVLLTLRYLTDAKKRRTSADSITQKILDAFQRLPDIDFAYPTTRFYQMPGEEKK
ncbi:MAG: mechanosensitive ion channel family protein [Spirochaetes bacterium]|nr:MAG: mechanosensitive ion channel family protein [Spirochaetota bacterium]